MNLSACFSVLKNIAGSKTKFWTAKFSVTQCERLLPNHFWTGADRSLRGLNGSDNVLACLPMVVHPLERHESKENRSEDNHQHRDVEKKNSIKHILSHFDGYKGN
jgi:hypothetical protein